MLERCVEHLINNVLPAAVDYSIAENALSAAYAADNNPVAWEDAARTAKRQAANLAIAIDGLAERAQIDLGGTLTGIRQSVGVLCSYPNGAGLRQGSLDRVRGVANAYKHANLRDPNLPISSDADVLVVGLGYGLDGFGVGKFGGVEVIVRETSGTSWKFLGDVPATIRGWFAFLVANGATLPHGTYTVCGLQVYP